MKTMLPPDALLAFDALARTASFTAAADLLACTKSHISQSVKRLEAELATLLVLRTTRRVSLTEAGIRLAVHAAALREMLQQSRRDIEGLQATVEGPLRISATQAFGQTILAPILVEFSLQYPAIRLELDTDHRLKNPIADGIDFCLRSRTVGDENLVARHLGLSQKRIYASASYLAQAGRLDHPCDLMSHRVLLELHQEQEGSWLLECEGKIEQIELHSQFSIDSYASTASAVAAGFGVALLPAYIAEPLVSKGEIQEVLPGWQPAPYPFYLVYPYHHPLPKKYEAFIQFVVPRIQARLQNNLSKPLQ
ncbi:LysR family transcriptional regulator [Iodobacter fluviatilis]|uniref:D-malate degradation protein R n=1 Tax=Iodobacter fluviatilis TaxID=537 RepID=A0A377Q360_9NEIS|nr:LysR family transcriptional regulator [Iodobacter fluviatilis]TCU90346.1 DNA-binding transcriptional LysR family regulator [Iodobacter fluviatilis]STQ89373.1 D-malate degradation protein R [Iodobacter fluviatilis]